MSFPDFFIQFLNGLATASSLFLVASGLSIIFGVTRIINFAHGSFYMLGAYLAYSLVEWAGGGLFGFWGGVLLSALLVGLIGAVLEMLLLRRIYRSPELFPLLATFGLVMIIADVVLLVWGPEDLLGPRAPGLEGAVQVLGLPFPEYEILLILLGPMVLGLLWLLFRRTVWGLLVRAATQDREMVSALGVNQAWLFTSVFLLGSFLAGLGGAVQLPRETLHHGMDMQIIAETFVVVVIGGMGSLPGAYLAAVLIGELHAFGILLFPQSTLVLVFLVMAVVLIVRPWGLLGRPESHQRTQGSPAVTRPAGGAWGRRLRTAAGLAAVVMLLLPLAAGDYLLYVATEILIFMLFAASLHFILGTGGMISFGHAAYFGLGAYGAALSLKLTGIPFEGALVAAVGLAGAGALLFGWFCVRLSGVYLAMLTLAFAQISHAVAFQWYDVTGGDNGLLGIWPSPWASTTHGFYYLTLALCGGALLALGHTVHTPFGYTLRAVRDSPMRADAIGINSRGHQWLSFAYAGLFAGLAGGLFAFFKGGVFPDTLGIPTSVDGLVMVLMGGLQSLSGPIVGAAVYKTLRIFLMSWTDYWRLAIGCLIVLLVAAFPLGLMGYLQARFGRGEEQP